MKSLWTTLALLAAAGSPAFAQDTRAEVMAPVRALFDAMRRGDSAAVRAQFAPDARLGSVAPTRTSPTEPQLSMDALDGFLKSVGTPHKEVYDERIWDERVEVSGPLASVWVQYAFFLGETFSHCGVDAFQLARVGGAWRIFSLFDTRQRQGCAQPPTRPLDGSVLIQRDRKFAAEVASLGFEGWMRGFADDAALPSWSGKSTIGKVALRERDAANFADSTSWRLTWVPAEGVLYADQRSGYTRGRYTVVAKADGKVLSSGEYLTVWRRDPDGEWRVILDTGVPDSAPR